MGRIRTIKPEFFTDEELSALDAETHLLAAGLLCYADDHGYFNANPGLIKAAVFPLREPSLNIPEMLRRLQEIGYVSSGKTPEGKQVGRIVKFSEHQRVSHPSPSKIKDLSVSWEQFRNPPENFGNAPGTFRQEGKGREQGKEGKGSAEAPPVATGPEEIPEGLAPTQYAQYVLEEAGFLGNDFTLTRNMGGGIEAIAKSERCQMNEATRRMLERVRRQPPGTKLVFWLRDAGYKATGDMYDQFLAQGA